MKAITEGSFMQWYVVMYLIITITASRYQDPQTTINNLMTFTILVKTILNIIHLNAILLITIIILFLNFFHLDILFISSSATRTVADKCFL